jgi:hypothetical protein
MRTKTRGDRTDSSHVVARVSDPHVNARLQRSGSASRHHGNFAWALVNGVTATAAPACLVGSTAGRAADEAGIATNLSAFAGFQAGPSFFTALLAMTARAALWMPPHVLTNAVATVLAGEAANATRVLFTDAALAR